MLTRLRQWLPWPDVVGAAVLLVAAIVWVAATRHGSHTSGPISDVKVSAVPHGFATPAPHALAAPEPPGGQYIADGPDSSSAAPLLINSVATAMVAFRRRLPYVAFIVALGILFSVHNGNLVWPGFVAVMILSYSVVAHGRYLWGSLALLLVAAGIAAHEFSESIPSMPGWLGPFALLIPVGLAAATIRAARDRADASARRALALEHEQEATARAAMAEERARIARELHDVVSHHVSVMVIQAAAAGKVIGTRPDLAASALTAIESSGREAMGELRHLLGLVAPVDDRLHPQPGLNDLDTLIAAVRAAGQPVTLRSDFGTIPQGIDLTAYRVVQEGLTNALRYAPGAATRVELLRDGDVLVVDVRNNRSAGDPATFSGGGSGLAGLAERLRLHEGTFEAGRRVGGGFRITARIPVHSPQAEDFEPAQSGIPTMEAGHLAPEVA